MVDERADEFGHVPSSESRREDYDEKTSSVMEEDEGRLLLAYDEDVEEVGEAEKQQFERAVQVLEETGRAEIEDIHYSEEPYAGEENLVAVVYAEDEDRVENFVEPEGEGTELVVTDIEFDFGLHNGLKRHIERMRNEDGEIEPYDFF